MVFLRDNTGFVLLHSVITQQEADEVLAFVYGLEFMDEVDNILVSINSPGGSVFAGLSIFSALRNSTKNVETRIEGIGASISGVIFLAGEKRTMLDYSTFMMHDPSGGDVKVLAKIKGMLKSILSKDFDSKKLDKMMADETWFDAKEMKRMKIIDKIINTNKEVELELSNEIEERYAICNNILKNKYSEMEENKTEETVEVINEAVEIKEEVIETENNVEETETETEEVIETENNVEEDTNELLINELKTQLDKALVENKSMREELNIFNEVKIKQGKLEVLNKTSITEEDYEKWMNLDIDTIKNLTENLTVNVESPKIEINKEEIDINNMSKEEKLRFSERDPKKYVDLIRKSNK